MRKFLLSLIVCTLVFVSQAQINNVFDNETAHYSPPVAKVLDDFHKAGSIGATIIWNNGLSKNSEGNYVFSITAPITFTSFGVGWTADNTSYAASAFEVTYRARINGQQWGKWYAEDGYVMPDETPTNLYWTDLLFLDNEQQHHEMELIFTPPAGVSILELRLSLMDMTGTGAGSSSEPVDLNDAQGIQNCPPFPTIIPRSQWCGSYNACHNTTSYANISPTHLVVHHGASPNTYTDGTTVVRGYWNYHVNTLGWSDIGYNYLFCKTGNFYQGRHNPNLPNTDVRGAHAGNANNGSIGINFLGNADVTLPTTAQLNKLKDFSAWWFNHKGLDPTSSAGMTTQAFGWQVKPRICGHRDVGQTSCPGNTLHGHLPSIRTGTKAIIDACGSPPPPTGPTNLAVSVGNCPVFDIVFNWTNSGTGWYILLATDQAYTTPYIKWVSGLTTYTGPSGFVLQSDGTTPLVLTEGQTYYWKIWDGSTFTNGPAFTAPICDDIPPTTSITTQGNWKTQDFAASFTDVDNPGGTGVARRYYQVADFDGNYWRANHTRGFFTENFEVIDTALWTVPAGGGIWNVANNTLVQSDAALNNTNIYAPLTQTLSNRYLYHFTAKVEGPSHANGRRFGLHFFADDGALSNRGNSYFIWFRIDSDKLEFYKVTNNVFSLESVVDDVAIVPGTYYDFKVVFDRITGEMYVYRNDMLIGTWVDQQPFSNNGNYISFRTGNAELNVSDLNVFRTRSSNVTVTVGPDSGKDIRQQNQSPSVYAGRIKSIAVDSAQNVSQTAQHNVNVDWTKPDTIAYVNDGLSADIDTTSSFAELSANWAASVDVHSDIESYWYAIGTAPGDTNIVNWTNNGTNTNTTHSGLNLSLNTHYYFSVKARNGAGLWSDLRASDGVIVYQSSAILAANFNVNQNIICTGEGVSFYDQSIGAVQYEWVFQGGTPPTSNNANPIVVYDTAGIFDVELRVFDAQSNSDTLTLVQYITVNPSPKANFMAIDTILYLPNAVAFFSNTSAHAGAFLWSFGDTYISTDANPWHQYQTAGQYSVELLVFNSLCGNDTLTKPNYILVMESSGINDFTDGLHIHVLQNPLQNTLNLELYIDSPLRLNFDMIDMLGRVYVLSDYKQYDSGSHSLEWQLNNSMSSGIYTLRVASDKEIQAVIKLIKL